VPTLNLNVVQDNDISSPNDDLFQHIYKKWWSSNENELDLYLGCPIVAGGINGTNLLEWWKVWLIKYNFIGKFIIY
jgi:hypothetical protein